MHRGLAPVCLTAWGYRDQEEAITGSPDGIPVGRWLRAGDEAQLLALFLSSRQPAALPPFARMAVSGKRDKEANFARVDHAFPPGGPAGADVPAGLPVLWFQPVVAEASLLLLKPSESPEEDSQAPAQAVTIVIRAGEPALEPCVPPKSASAGQPCLPIPRFNDGVLEASKLEMRVLPLRTTELHCLLPTADLLPHFGLRIRHLPQKKHCCWHKLCQFSV